MRKSISLTLIAFALVLAALAQSANAIYLPGTAPHDYREGDPVEVSVNVLTSVHTHLPFDYYSLPFCFPTQKFKGEPENLGEILMGDRIKPSPYEKVVVGENVDCQQLCSPRQFSPSHVKQLIKLINEDYHVNLIMDHLPLAQVHEETGMFVVGVPLGILDNNVPYLYNHLHFTVKYYEFTIEEMRKHQEAEARKAAAKGKTTPPEDITDGDEFVTIKRIISFVAKPMSVRHDPDRVPATCSPHNFTVTGVPAQKATDDKVVFSYGITWERTDARWSTRWDVYLNVEDHEIHWMSIANSIFIVLFLTSLVAVILTRALRKDFKKYNRTETDPEDLIEETGWKMVHKDVFRPPTEPWLLAAFAGTGVQLLGMTFVVIVIACLGFLSPANRGALFSALLVCFVFLGMYAGYTSARLLKLWGCPSWKYIFFTGSFVPGVAFNVFFLINLAVWSTGSAAAVPFFSMIAMIAMWFCISLPLVFVGAVMGFKADTIKLPVSVNQIPRHIPEPTWHLNPYFTILLAGILPFGAVFIEVFFILTAVWLNRYYYVFGFLLLVFVILFITCAEITLVMVYFQLCAEDYRWWWRSFLTSGSCGLYLFLYSVFYFFSSAMKIRSFVPILLYFGYMGLLSFVFSVMTGTIGFLSSFGFVRYIYASIKLD